MIEKMDFFEVRDRRNGNWFWCQNLMLKAKLPHTIKLTYFALCSYANKNTETCHPGMRKIAEIAGISSRSVVDAIKILDEGKAIKAERKKGRVNKYSLLKLSVATIALLQSVAQKCSNSRHKSVQPRETKQTKGTNERNNKGFKNLRKTAYSL